MLGCVCGSDLWYYRGESAARARPDRPRVHRRRRGRRGRRARRLAGAISSIAPFTFCDGTCPHCLTGWPSNCAARRLVRQRTASTAARARRCASRFADATLVPVPGSGHSDEMLRSLLTLSDVMCTGHHAAVSAGVKPGDVVAVSATARSACAPCSPRSGSAPSGSSRSAATRPARSSPASSAPPTSSPARRRGNQAVLEMTDGVGVDAALECVGTGPVDGHRVRDRASRLDRRRVGVAARRRGADRAR